MQAIILAAGEGVRMHPLTHHLPKPLLRIGGKPVLDHLVESLPQEVDEIVLVIRHLGDMIQRYCGSVFHGRPVTYVQGPSGTAPSFLATKSLVKEGRFLVLYGDEVPSPLDFSQCLRYPASVLCWELPDPWNHGIARLRPNGTIAEIVEKSPHPPGNLVSGGVMVVDHRIFSYVPTPGPTGELFFSSLLNQFVRDIPTVAVRAEWGIGGLSTPDDLERIDRWFTERNILL